jgi:hypothetical protein
MPFATIPRVLSFLWSPWWAIHVSPRTWRPKPPSQSFSFELHAYFAYVFDAFRSNA